jgi:hypothetical protein
MLAVDGVHIYRDIMAAVVRTFSFSFHSDIHPNVDTNDRARAPILFNSTFDK